VLAYDRTEPVLDEAGMPVTRWDGRTTKTHPITEEEVPDESARTPLLRYINPKRADWPKSDYVVGNPPFIGNKRMRSALGNGYVEALRGSWSDVPETVDFVMYWWHHAAELTRTGNPSRFGFITTNSITQSFNRRVVQSALESGVSLVFAIPNHPWVDSEEGAAVRVGMTVGTSGELQGTHLTVSREQDTDDGTTDVQFIERSGIINADLSLGAKTEQAVGLKANKGLSFMGVSLIGQGFVLSDNDPLLSSEGPTKPYVIGKDLNRRPDKRWVIDFYGLAEEQARSLAPEHFQRVLDRVKPERDHNNRLGYREKWWLFGEQRSGLRKAAVGLNRFVATCRTAKHRVFVFVSGQTLIESTVIGIMLADAFYLGVLSSRLHVVWSLKVGTRLGVGNDPRYNNSICFETFPFPLCNDRQGARIRELAEELDAHRKRRLASNSELILTDAYNVLEKIRSGEPLTDNEKVIHEQGLISVLKRIHDDLDAAVFDAYGWPSSLTDDEILDHLLALNMERAAQEAQGEIRWLRPDFQNPTGKKAATQGTLIEETEEPEETTAKKAKLPWPKTLPERAQAVKAALAAQRGPVTPEQLAKTFLRARVDGVEELLETLASLGQARELADGRFVAPKSGR
jgi:hypothetical protein